MEGLKKITACALSIYPPPPPHSACNVQANAFFASVKDIQAKAGVKAIVSSTLMKPISADIKGFELPAMLIRHKVADFECVHRMRTTSTSVQARKSKDFAVRAEYVCRVLSTFLFSFPHTFLFSFPHCSKWYAAYSSPMANEKRAEAKLCGGACNRVVADMNDVIVLSLANDMADLEAFSSNPALKEGMAKAGVVSEPEMTKWVGFEFKMY